MREDEIIAQIVSELDTATASDVDVRTVGTDQDIQPPEIVLSWTARRLDSYNGHNAFASYLTDNSGNQTGREYHIYFQMEVDCIARSYDEFERDRFLDTVQRTFIPYEYDATNFHRDTGEWDIGETSPRGNPLYEPDWFESGVLLTFTFVKRVEDTDTAEPIETIQTDITVDESLEDTSDS